MDDALLKALGEALGTKGRFGHREHLLLAWRCLHATDPKTAERWMGAAVQHVASRHGTPNKYHETLTVAWTRLVAAHVTCCDAPTFEEFITQNSALLDSHLPERHFSAAALSNDRARREWVEPDLSRLPSLD